MIVDDGGNNPTLLSLAFNFYFTPFSCRGPALLLEMRTKAHLIQSLDDFHVPSPVVETEQSASIYVGMPTASPSSRPPLLFQSCNIIAARRARRELLLPSSSIAALISGPCVAFENHLSFLAFGPYVSSHQKLLLFRFHRSYD